MKGTGVSPGIAIGKAYIIKDYKYDFSENSSCSVEEALETIESAISKSVGEIKDLKVHASTSMGEEEAKIFDAHLEIVKDPQMLKEIKACVTSGNPPLLAVKTVTEKYIGMFESMEDEYFKERARDIEDIQKRLYRNVMGYKEIDLSDLPKDTILVSRDLTPSETAIMDKKNVVGFITEVGGSTSHTAIIARNLGIPAVMGIKRLTHILEESDILVVDGGKGNVFLPNEQELETFKSKKKTLEKIKRQLDQVKKDAAITIDGREVEIFSNIGNPEEALMAVEEGAEGIGLFRTEFLYMESKDFPSEEVQYQAYKKTLEHVGVRPTIFRTLDIGGDKDIPYFDIPKEDNPFLGWRAIRICFDMEDLFVTQLRALLRASVHGRTWIMFPMISSIEDIEKAIEGVEEAKYQLRKEGIPYDENVKLGIMIEIPSVAVIANQVCKYVDFMSIGTNDLTQYTLACDRINDKVAKYYDSFQPGVLHLINQVIKAGRRNETIIGMCGEFAGNPLAVPLLLGMGLKEFSMSPKSIAKTKKIINSFSYEEAKMVAERVLSMDRSSDIKAYLENLLVDKHLDYILEV